MRDLQETLNDYDPGMLPALAEVWGVDHKRLPADDLLPRLHQTMRDPAAAEATWDKLDEDARTALQLLISSAGRRMKTTQFERFYGVARKLGKAGIDKEKPHTQGANVAETLYYRGFIAEAYASADGHLVGFVYVAEDLAEALPLHKTSYERLDEAQATPAELPSLAVIDEPQAKQEADTTIVDDMTTLLAYLQANETAIQAAALADDAAAALMPHLLDKSENRLAFLLGVGISAGLVTVEERLLQPERNIAREFLSAERSDQVKALALAWLGSDSFQDMWHVPGLFPDDSGWAYDAASARDAVMSLLASCCRRKAGSRSAT